MPYTLFVGAWRLNGFERSLVINSGLDGIELLDFLTTPCFEIPDPYSVGSSSLVLIDDNFNFYFKLVVVVVFELFTLDI